MMESLYSIATLKSLGLTDNRGKHWLNLNIEAINADLRITKLNMLFGGIQNLITSLDQVIILWLGALMVIDNQMTLGMFVAFNAYRGQFSDSTAKLTELLLQLRALSLHNERLSDIVLSEPEKQLPSRPLIPSGTAVSLDIKNLSWQYDNFSQPIIKEVNLHIRAGENVAITGPSGIGKTTLMKLMTGLIIPTEGSILINDLDIYSVGLNNYRHHIASVLQDDKLLAGSILDNITGFSPNPDIKYVEECAKLSNIMTEIQHMPMGYQTLISELGGSLSGGQKQRLLIARALYRRPSILFMDEATSHLDLGNEAYINTAIANLKITRVIIAHRPSTIASADRIINLEQVMKCSQRPK